MSIAAPPRLVPGGIVPLSKGTLVDNYERWYMEPRSNNRMALSLRSTIPSEIEWALNRLHGLFKMEHGAPPAPVTLITTPGLLDALFEWPEWYADNWTAASAGQSEVFGLSVELAQKQSHANGSLWVLRHAAMIEHISTATTEIASHRKMMPIITSALKNLDPDSDDNSEFILHCIDILQLLAPTVLLSSSFPVGALERIAGTSSDRSLIMSSMMALEVIYGNPANSGYLRGDSLALTGSLRYLPLFVDGPLVEAVVNYLYVHLSNTAMSKAFLFHPQMSSTLKVLVNYLLKHQPETLQTSDLIPAPPSIPAFTVPTKDHDLTPEELDGLLSKPEPQRCYDWMKTMFVRNTQGELTQVAFWELYKNTWQPYQERHPLLIAADVIKNVNVVFPEAQAMVISGPTPRFVVRGVARTQDVTNERFKCRWLRGECSETANESLAALYDHVLSHLASTEDSEMSCMWANCTHGPLPRSALRLHALTHLPSSAAPQTEASQSQTVTVSAGELYPMNKPTSRAIPPSTDSRIIWMAAPAAEPPATALTALLCIRILFRTTYASTDAAPRVDEDHFGFPGTVEDAEDVEVEVVSDSVKEEEQRGCQRGRKAFVGVAKLMECVNIQDDVLMSWISEMVDVVSDI